MKVANLGEKRGTTIWCFIVPEMHAIACEATATSTDFGAGSFARSNDMTRDAAIAAPYETKCLLASHLAPFRDGPSGALVLKLIARCGDQALHACS